MSIVFLRNLLPKNFCEYALFGLPRRSGIATLANFSNAPLPPVLSRPIDWMPRVERQAIHALRHILLAATQHACREHRARADAAPASRDRPSQAAQKNAYRIADNKLPENAGWDKELLKIEMGDLDTFGFDTALLGFSDKEMSRLMGRHAETSELTCV